MCTLKLSWVQLIEGPTISKYTIIKLINIFLYHGNVFCVLVRNYCCAQFGKGFTELNLLLIGLFGHCLCEKKSIKNLKIFLFAIS